MALISHPRILTKKDHRKTCFLNFGRTYPLAYKSIIFLLAEVITRKVGNLVVVYSCMGACI